MDRQRLLKRIDTAWRAFKESYAGLSEAQLMEPGVSGVWSVRDIIAHVTTWEEEALKHLPSILEDRRPPRYPVTYGGIDAFNAQMTQLKGGLVQVLHLVPGSAPPRLRRSLQQVSSAYALAT
jgi:DinB superfamily